MSISGKMLYGIFSYNIDPKGRVTVPAKFRGDLGSESMITRGLDGCLVIYSEREWQEIDAHLEKLNRTTNADARALARHIWGNAAPTEYDKQGRVLIPKNLRDYAGLTKEVIFVGLRDRVEIWDKDRYESAETGEEFSIESATARLDEIGEGF